MCATLSSTLPIHLLVPVLPQVQGDLGIGPASVQWAITAYLVGLAGGQLILGPLSDGIGRKPVLLAGMALYCAATIGVAGAQDLVQLVGARLLQGIGGCAGLVLGRAMVRDLSQARSSTRSLALLSTAMSLSPGLAPVIATIVAPAIGWRHMLHALAAVMAVLLIVATIVLPETWRGRRDGLSADLRAYASVLRDATFLRICLGGACMTTGMYAFVANAAYILNDSFGVPLTRSGPFYFVIMTSITVGGLSMIALGPRIRSASRLAAIGAAMLVAGLASIAASRMPTHPLSLYMAAIMAFGLLVGIASPIAMSAALEAVPGRTGAASGVYGSCQMLLGAVLVATLGILPGPPEIATGITLVLASVVAILCFHFRRGLGYDRSADRAE